MTDTQTIDKSEKRPHHQNKTKRLGVGVKVREKIKGSGVWWVFVNHNRQRISKRVGSKKAALQVAETIQARLKLGLRLFSEGKPEKPPAPTLQA